MNKAKVVFVVAWIAFIIFCLYQAFAEAATPIIVGEDRQPGARSGTTILIYTAGKQYKNDRLFKNQFEQNCVCTPY